MAKTKNGIVYPDNYDKVADVPADLKELAESVDEVIENNKTEMKKSNETRDGKISKNAEDIGIIQETIKSKKESIDKSLENINTKNEKQDEDIKANKESIEALQAENLEIKAENERLREDIKSIATIGEASGENIHLEDSSDARCEIEIGGNQQQDTREGYNQLKNEGTTQTLNNVTITKKEDETLVVNGTATEDFTFSIKRNIELEDGEQYKLSGCPNGGDEKKYALTINQYYENQSHFGQDYGDGVNFTYNGSLPINNNIYIRLFKGITYNNLIFKPMIVKGTENKPYEQYGASPSLDYQSPVKSIGDNVNYFDINSVTNTLIILESGNLYPNDSWRTTDFIEVKANIYTLSWESITDYFQCNIAFYDKDKKILSYIKYANRTFCNTFDVKNNAKYMRISYSVKSGVTSYTREKIKLETGNKRTEYSSYNCGSARVDFQNKNVFKPQIEADIGGTIVKNQEDTIVINGNSTTAHQINFKNKVNYKPNTNYKVTITKVSGSCTEFSPGKKWAMLFYASSKTTSIQILPSSTTIKFSFVSPNGKFIPYFWFGFDSSSVVGTNSVFNNYTLKIQIEEENFSDYASPQEQSYLVDVQQPMFEGDTFVKQDGKRYEKHCWEKMLLNGTEKVGVSGASTNEVLAIVYDINNAVDGFGYSNYFLYSSQVELNKMSVYNDGKSLRVNVSKMQFADLESFKAKLKELYEAGTPVIIYYKLAEPILLECTEAQSKVLDEIYNKAHTYKNITNISVESAEVNPIASVKYLKDAETEHNKLQAQIDEIKQLLSTTETSALLVNNLEKDLRMEVE